MAREGRIVPTSLAFIVILLLSGLWILPADAAVKAKTADPDTPLHIVAESAIYKPANNLVTFTVRFDQHPDFLTTDTFGRPEDLFQYDVLGDPLADYPANFDAIIRIEPRWQSCSRLVIRRSTPPSVDPASGGWGPIRTTVQFKLRGKTLTFTVPLSAVSDHSTDGIFSYELDTYYFGSTVDHISGQSSIKAK